MTQRRSARTLVLALVAALAVPLGGGSAFVGGGADAAEGDATSPPAVVSARCFGGAGRMTVAVSPPNEDGDFPVTVTGSRVVEGSTWRVLVEREDAGPQRFRRTAVDGSWTVDTVVEASDGESQSAFDVQALGSVDGQPTMSCFGLVIVGDSVAAGLSECGRGLVGLVVRRRHDGAVAVGAVLIRGRAHQRWSLEVRAVSEGTAQTVAFQDYSNRWSELVSRVRFEGLGADPHFRLRISNPRGAHCRLGLVPGAFLDATTAGASSGLSPQRLLREHDHLG